MGDGCVDAEEDESSSETRPSPRVKQAVGTCRVPQGAQARRAGARGREGTRVSVACSCLSMAEASTALYGNHPPVKNK